MKFVIYLTTLALLPLAYTYRSYEDEVYDSVPEPTYEEMFDFGDTFHDESRGARIRGSLCDEDDDSCSDAMLQAAPEDNKSPAEKIKEKMSRQKDYEKAMKEGEGQAKKELQAVGGPDPYGGFLLPMEKMPGEEPKKKKGKIIVTKAPKKEPEPTEKDKTLKSAEGEEEPDFAATAPPDK